MIASSHPCENSHPNRVSNSRKKFEEFIIDGFDFNRGFRCSDV